MYYITDEILQTMSPETQKSIIDQGLSQEDMDNMSEEEKAKLMIGQVQIPDENSDPEVMAASDRETRGENKLDDSLRLPKALKYGDEEQFVDELQPDGRIKELSESKKNAITSMDDAAARGQALISKSLEKPKVPFKKFMADESKQKELEQ